MPIAPAAEAPVAPKRHAMSLIGDPKYPADYRHFDYANPDAPKGGLVRMPVVGSFDSLNVMLFRGMPAAGLTLIYDSLFADSLEESSTNYGQIAEWASYPDDYSSVTFTLRPEARWHDGRQMTTEDVIWSLDTWKNASPQQALYYKNVARAEETAPGEVTFFFDVKNNRELPMIMGQLIVLPKHWWTATDANGAPRDPMKTTLEMPLGSGSYKVKRVSPGRTVSYERVNDYWGRDLPVNRGQNNFDEIRFEYYRDSTIAFESFKAGNLDYYTETSAKNWATAYNFPAMQSGKVKKEEIKLGNIEFMQGFVLNLRRPQFQDARVRRAFNLAFDFEWANKNLFYGQYKRTSSYFENSELAATGVPEGREREILDGVKAEIPPELFTAPYANPANGDRNALRDHLREAADLLAQAGWTVRTEEVADPDCGFWCGILNSVGLGAPKTARTLRNKEGQPFEVEFLLVQPDFERIVQPYIQNLERLGIRARIRIVDSPQYQRRTDDFDFDIVTSTFPQSESPGNEQRDFWGSDAAKQQGSRNLIGIQNPAIDKIVDTLIFAKDRPELVAATRALDRVLLWNHYLVPQWHSPASRIAYWDRYAHPETLPKQTVGFLQVWWQRPDAPPPPPEKDIPRESSVN